MIVILKPNSGDKEIEQVISSLKHYDLNFNISKGSHTTIIGLVGDTAKVDSEKLETNPVVRKL